MPYVHFAIEMLIIIVAIPILVLAFKLAAWEENDDYRRLERKAHLNLMRQSGRNVTEWVEDASL